MATSVRPARAAPISILETHAASAGFDRSATPRPHNRAAKRESNGPRLARTIGVLAHGQQYDEIAGVVSPRMPGCFSPASPRRAFPGRRSTERAEGYPTPTRTMPTRHVLDHLTHG